MKFKNYIEEKKEEFAIWGIPPQGKEEKLLFTKAKTEKEAQGAVVLLKKKGCTNLRIQNFSMGDKDISQDWKKILK